LEESLDPALLFAALPFAAFVLRRGGEVLAWNPAAERAWGFGAGDPGALPAALSGGAGALAAAAARVLDGGSDDAVEVAWAAPSGAPRKALLRAVPVGRPPSAALLVASDPAAGADEPGALRARRLQAVLDAIPAPIFFKGADGRYLGCNAEFERYLGVPRAELLGKSVFDVAPVDLARVYRAADDALFGSGGTQIYESRVQWADGTRRDVVFHKAAIRDEAGAVAGLAGAMLDVTDLRAAERSLREALDTARSTEASFRQLVESIPDLVVIHGEGRMIYANPAMLAVMGRPLEAVVGLGVVEWVHPDDHAAVRPFLEAGAPMPPRELRIRSGRGGWTRAEFLALGIEMSGRPVRVAIGRDLTERHQAQERLALAQRLAAVGTLAAGVAHELNNPLTFVLANVEVVANAMRHLRGAPPDADGWDEALHALDDALEGAERMRVIVRDLRTMARSDQSFEGAVEVRRLLEVAANLAWNEVRPRARLTWDVGEVPPVRGSEGRLGQVFVNLIVNAAHAIPEGDPHAHAIRLSAARQEDGRVAISVADTGAGIPPEHLPRIFDPFFTTKPAGVGTGLGLWVCHNIVSAYGGALDVSSEVGRGTTFRVVLPAAQPGAAQRPRPAASRDGRPRRRLLVVDDEPLVAATVRRQLASDFVVDAASGACDALARVAAHRYDAIVCDVVMEGPSGLDFLDALRGRAPALAERVLFVTGGASRETSDLLAACGAPWLPKPFDGRQLRQALRELLSSAA
jgi:two-component system cell cycle sensor histidine kinase/response regulator CckA